jgi:DNA-binding IclR family transcriptional regulator
MSFTTIAIASKLPQATLHRLLSSMLHEGLVHLDRMSRRYCLGHLLHELGLVALPQVRFAEYAQQALHRLAALTGDTVYLSERVGNEAVATACEEGSFPFKTLTLHVGMRRPLGVGAGGLAILSTLPQEEVERIVQANALYLPALASFDSEFLLTAVGLARERGYAYLDSQATRGMAAMGIALHDEKTGGRAAISIAAISERMTLQKAELVAATVREEARGIEIAMRDPAGNRSLDVKLG